MVSFYALLQVTIAPSVPLKEIPSIHLIPHIIQHFVVAVGDDGLALFFKLLHIIHHAATEEGAAVLQGGLIDDDFRSLGLNPLHDPWMLL